MSHLRPLGFYDRKTLTPIRLIAETVAMFGRSKSEIELLKASLAGNAQAFGTVIDTYASLVCAITYSATGDVAQSEELAQEAFLRAWKSLGQLKDLGKFRPWLCRIARSTVQNWCRRQRRDVAGQAGPLEAAADKPSDEIGPVEAAMTRAQETVVSQALAQIPENLREPLILFYREQQSTREVARQLGLSENAARQRISRGRSMLRVQVAAMVETTIARTKPSKAFKTAVIAALAGTAVETSTTATAAILSTLAVKATLTAAGIALVVGTVLVHRRITKPNAAAVASEGIESVTLVSSEPEVTAYASNRAAGAAERGLGIVLAPVRTDAQPAPQNQGQAPAAEAPRSSVHKSQPPGAQPQGVLSGVITDSETGEPVPDALVQISSGRQFRTKTNAEGFYRFDEVHQAGSFHLSVDALTHVGIRRGQENPVVNLSNDRQTVRDFQLPKACMVDVWVVDQNGVGIAEARVVAGSLLDAYGRAPGHFADGRSTDPNGYVLLGGIPPANADYLITAWHDVEVGLEKTAGGYFRRTAYDYAPGRTVVRLPDPNEIPQVTIGLEQGQDVPGYAEYIDGVPAAGVRLIPRPGWWHSIYSVTGPETAHDGTFTFKHITPGAYHISRYITQSGGRGTTRSLTQIQLPPVDGAPLVLRIPEKSPQALVSISGTITFLGANTPGYVSVEAYSATGAHTSSRASSEPDGTTRFVLKQLERGRHTLMFSGTGMEDKTLRDVVAPANDLEVEMSYSPRPKLTGTVLDAETGSPIPRFSGRVRKMKTLRGSSYVQQNRWIQFDDPLGEFSLDTVGPGIYEVQIHADGYAPRWSDPINTDETMRVQLSLTAGGTITGIVVDEEGQAIIGAKVTPLSRACGVMPQTREAFASEDGAVETAGGAFALNDLPPGSETLKTTGPDYAFSIVKGVVVREGATTADVEIVLTRGATVEGRVYDDHGRPQAGQTLFFQNAHGYGDSNFDDVWRLASAVTDSNGFYQIDHLPEDVCYVKRADTYRTLGVVRRAIVPRADRVTQLDFGGTPIVGGVVVVNGVPQAKPKLRLIPADTTHVRTFTSFTMTDEHGGFAFSGVAPGTHAIYYQHPGKPTRWLKIATVDVADSDVDLGIIPRSTADLLVTVAGLDANPAWAVQRLTLAEPDSTWPVPVRIAEAPEAAGAPWVFHDVDPGNYKLILDRADRIQWRQEISLDAGLAQWQLSLAIPQSLCQVTGRTAGIDNGRLTFWREGGDLFGTIRPNPDGTFTITNLPPGKYGIGPGLGLLYNVPPLVEFNLHSEESRTIDFDLTALPESQMAFLNVQVFDKTGAACREARLWLAASTGRIEPLQFTAAGHIFLTKPGRQRLHVDVSGYHPVEKDLLLEPGDLFSTSFPPSILILLERL